MKTNSITLNSQVLSNSSNLRILFLQQPENSDQGLIIQEMISQIKKNFSLDLGFYPNEERFITDLSRRVFGDSTDAVLPNLENYKEIVLKIVTDATHACYKEIPINGDLNVFIFPMSDREASDDLDGVNAFAVGKNTIYILLDPENKNWQISLKYTIAHEYAHLVSAGYFPWDTILAGIVFEGLAECFRESIFGGERAKYSTVLSKKDAISNLLTLSLSDILSPNDEEHYDLYLSYFFGTRELPNWYGYSLGYWLIVILLETQKMTLMEIFKTHPTKVLEIYNQK